VRPSTIAKSLAIGNPAAGAYALQTLQECDGEAVAAPENEIVECIRLLAETEGVFTETAGGVVISALRKLAKSSAIKPDEVTVAYITGNGLKTQEVVDRYVEPVFIDPTYESFQKAVSV